MKHFEKRLDKSEGMFGEDFCSKKSIPLLQSVLGRYTSFKEKK